MTKVGVHLCCFACVVFEKCSVFSYEHHLDIVIFLVWRQIRPRTRKKISFCVSHWNFDYFEIMNTFRILWVIGKYDHSTNSLFDLTNYNTMTYKLWMNVTLACLDSIICLHTYLFRIGIKIWVIKLNLLFNFIISRVFNSCFITLSAHVIN